MDENKSSVGRLISLIYRSGHIYIGKQLREYNIGKGQYTFLNALYKKDGISQEEIANYLKIDKGTTAKAIKKLEEEGYVYRKVDENDKRAYKVFLAEKAIEIKPVVRGVLRSWMDILTAGFTEEEREYIINMLEKMGSNAAKYVDDGDI